MTQVIQTNWVLFAVLLAIALAACWWLFGRANKPAPRQHRPDVLDEGAAPAQRNQALIDAPPASAIVAPVVPMTTVDTMGGLGEVIADSAAEERIDAEPLAWPAEEPAEEGPAPGETADDLSRLKGVGPKLIAALHAMGVTRYAQIAGWTDMDIARVDSKMPPAFQGRIARDAWVEQARLLAGGDVAGYEEKFGKL